MICVLNDTQLIAEAVCPPHPLSAVTIGAVRRAAEAFSAWLRPSLLSKH